MKQTKKQILLFWLCSILLAAVESRTTFTINREKKFNLFEAISSSPALTSNTIMGSVQRPSYDEYLKSREEIVNEEKNRSLGSDILLNEPENQANKILMKAKIKEYDIGYENPYKFLPSRHIFEVLEEIKTSNVFKILKKMPKGAILHAHDTALVSANYLVELTYRENLWQCNNTETKRPSFKFSRSKPQVIDNHCEWKLVADERTRLGAKNYDRQVRKLFTLFSENPSTQYKDINDVWNNFMNNFIVTESLITYEPVWKDYFRQALKEFYEDGVQYLEFRGTLPPVYNLDGDIYSQVEMVQWYKDISDQFVKDNPGFIGSKFIYAPIKAVTDEKIDEYIELVQVLKERFPDYLAGFDLVGQEDTARPLYGLASKMLQLPDDIKFFFHAGETNWYGTESDENLIDAILMGTERIGHGYALVKHPKLLELIKERNIVVEVNPVSNQVLKLVDDLRNHPCAILFSDNYRVVISSDDPSFWEATPLSHDFYEAFMGIASKNHDLRLLKRLALNSLEFSAMSNAEKKIALEKWNSKWDGFISDISRS